MDRAVEIDRADDLPGDDIGDPDVAVLAAGEIDPFAVRRERHAKETGIDVDTLHRRRVAVNLSDQAQRERPGPAVERREHVAVR